MADSSKEYRPSWVVDLLHSFPHFDLTFQEVNSTFNWADKRYQESLLLWSALPVFWLLLTLLLFLTYFCYRCCRRDAAHRHNVTCLKWTMAIFVLLSCGAAGVGFYGNEEIKKESAHLITSANSSFEAILRIQNQLHKLESSINETVASGMTSINAIYTGTSKLSAATRHDLIRQTKSSFMVAEEVLDFYYKNTAMQLISSTDAKGIIKLFKEYGSYRWLVTTAFLCWLILLYLMLLLGISKLSKCTLLTFCTFGIFSLVKCWISAGLHLGVTVGLADYCASPHTTLQEVGSEYLDTNIINYYMHCNTEDPFKDALEAAMERVRGANDTLNRALEVAQRYITRSELDSAVLRVYAGLGNASECIVQLSELSKCTVPSRDYTTAVNTVCSTILQGLVLLTLSFGASGLLLSLLVVMASRAWRSFGTRELEESYPKPATEAHEDEGPFLPRPGGGPAPSYYRYGAPAEYGRPGPIPDDYMPYARGNIQVQLAMQRQASPAPPPMIEQISRLNRQGQYSPWQNAVKHQSIRRHDTSETLVIPRS